MGDTRFTRMQSPFGYESQRIGCGRLLTRGGWMNVFEQDIHGTTRYTIYTDTDTDTFDSEAQLKKQKQKKKRKEKERTENHFSRDRRPGWIWAASISSSCAGSGSNPQLEWN